MSGSVVNCCVGPVEEVRRFFGCGSTTEEDEEGEEEDLLRLVASDMF